MSPRPGDLVTPGERLCASTPSHLPGTGVYIHNGHLHASLLGELTYNTTTHILSVEPPSHHLHQQQQPPHKVVPYIGAIVIGRITRVNPRMASVDILAIDDIAVDMIFHASIRQIDVRKEQVDKVNLYDCFRPGDIIKAKVISLGDKFVYFLSTASNDLGVIYAVCSNIAMTKDMEKDYSANNAMIPVSWVEMMCPVTKVKEFRKVAKV